MSTKHGTLTYASRLAASNQFGPAELEANSRGSLTLQQRRRLGAGTHVVITFAAIVAAMALAFGIVAAATWHLANGVGTGTAAVAVACLLVAVATITRSRQVREESESPHIAVYEGRIVKQTSAQVPPAHSRKSAYFYTIAGAHLPVSPEAYEVLDDSRAYRVFYLARTHQLLSMEVLSDVTT